MNDTDPLPARFTISDAAKQEIENIRVAWNERFNDPAEVVMVGWGEGRTHAGQPWENIVVSFYGRSQYADIAHSIQQVSGLPVVFFTIPLHATKFDGKIVDFAPAGWFFLRNP